MVTRLADRMLCSNTSYMVWAESVVIHTHEAPNMRHKAVNLHNAHLQLFLQKIFFTG